MAMKMAMKTAMKASMKKSSPMKKAMKAKSGMKRPLNQYFKLVMDARKKDLPSFTYNGNTYVKKANPIAHLPAIYKKK